MAKKALRKQNKYRQDLKELARAGKINKADGTFEVAGRIPYSSDKIETMHLAGAKGKF